MRDMRPGCRGFWCWRWGGGEEGERGMQPCGNKRAFSWRVGLLFRAPSAFERALIYVSWVLDSHYAGRRLTGCHRCYGRASPRAKNTGVECECISSGFPDASVSSPLWGHITVAGGARGPIRRSRKLVGGNRCWWWARQQSSWHGHGCACYHPHGYTVGARGGERRGVHGCGHPVGLDHRRVMDDVRRSGVQGLRVIGALLLWGY